MRPYSILLTLIIFAGVTNRASADFVDHKGLIITFAVAWYRQYYFYGDFDIAVRFPGLFAPANLPLHPVLLPSLISPLEDSYPALFSFLQTEQWREGEHLASINSLLSQIYQHPQLANALNNLIKKLSGRRRKDLRRLLFSLGQNENIILIRFLISNCEAGFDSFISLALFNQSIFRLMITLVDENADTLPFFFSLLKKAPQIIRMLLCQPDSTDIKTLLERTALTLQYNHELFEQICQFPTMGAIILVQNMHYDWGLPDEDLDDKQLAALHRLFENYIRQWISQYGAPNPEIDHHALATTFLYLFLHNPQTLMALFAGTYRAPGWFMRSLLLKLSQLEASQPGRFSEHVILKLIDLLHAPNVLQKLEKLSPGLSTAQLYVLFTRRTEDLKQWLVAPDNINHALLGIVTCYGCFTSAASVVSPGHNALTSIIANAIQSSTAPLYGEEEIPVICENIASILLALFPALGKKADREYVQDQLDGLFRSEQLDVEDMMPAIQAHMASQASVVTMTIPEELQSILNALEQIALTHQRKTGDKP